MTSETVSNTRRILRLWAGLVAAGFIVVALSNVPVLGHVERLRSQNYYTYVVAAHKAMQRNDFVNAFQQLDTAFALAPPDEPTPHKVAGDFYCAMRKWDQAVEEYLKAIELGDQETDVRLNVVWALVKLGRYPEAIELAKRTIHAGYAHPGLARSMAEAYTRAGDHAGAIPYIEEALKGYPNDFYLLEQLRDAYQKTGDRERAEAVSARLEEVQMTFLSFSERSSGQGDAE